MSVPYPPKNPPVPDQKGNGIPEDEKPICPKNRLVTAYPLSVRKMCHQ